MVAKLSIVRGPSTPEGTFGHAHFSASPISGFSLRTAELPWKDNKRGVSCIPTGTYRAQIYFSPRFKRDVLLLIDVPGRSNIEIHPGNFAGDESLGFHSDVDGCILPGFDVGALLTPKGNRQLAVTSSKAALNAIFNEMFDGSEIEVSIVNQDGS